MPIQCIDLHIDERQDTADLLPGADVPDKVDVLLLLTRIRCLIKGVHHEGGRHPVCFIYIRADDAPALLTQCPDHRIGTEGADRRDQGGTLCCIHTITFLTARLPRGIYLQSPACRGSDHVSQVNVGDPATSSCSGSGSLSEDDAADPVHILECEIRIHRQGHIRHVFQSQLFFLLKIGW